MQNINLVEGEESDNEVMVVDETGRRQSPPGRPQDHIVPIYLEASHDTQLKELGLFEEGMTEKQKQELLQVVAASKETADWCWTSKNPSGAEDDSPGGGPFPTKTESFPGQQQQQHSFREIRRNERKRKDQEIDSQLEELGLLEEGMTRFQKLEIMQVIKASRETALQEETMRKHLSPAPRPPSYAEACGSGITAKPTTTILRDQLEPEEDTVLSDEEAGGQPASGQSTPEEDEEGILEEGSATGEPPGLSSTKEAEAATAATVRVPPGALAWWAPSSASPSLPSKRSSSLLSLKEAVPYFCPEKEKAGEYTLQLLAHLGRYHRCLRAAQDSVVTHSYWGKPVLPSLDNNGDSDSLDLVPRRNKARTYQMVSRKRYCQSNSDSQPNSKKVKSAKEDDDSQELFPSAEDQIIHLEDSNSSHN